MFRAITTLYLLAISLDALPKGADVKTAPTAPINKVSPLDKEALLREVQWIIKDAIIGKLEVLDQNCSKLTLEVEKDYLKATVNKEFFYILKNSVAIDGQEYKSSTCYKKTLNDQTQVECIARSTKAIKALDETKALIFYISYTDRTIEKCPSLGTLFN